MYEVTSAGALVWEYVNPMAWATTSATVGGFTAVKFMTNPTVMSANQVFRSYRHDVNDPGIKSRLRVYPDGRVLPVTLDRMV